MAGIQLDPFQIIWLQRFTYPAYSDRKLWAFQILHSEQFKLQLNSGLSVTTVHFNQVFCSIWQYFSLQEIFFSCRDSWEETEGWSMSSEINSSLHKSVAVSFSLYCKFCYQSSPWSLGRAFQSALLLSVSSSNSSRAFLNSLLQHMQQRRVHPGILSTVTLLRILDSGYYSMFWDIGLTVPSGLGRHWTHPASWLHLSFRGHWPYWFTRDNSGCPGLMFDHIQHIPDDFM